MEIAKPSPQDFQRLAEIHNEAIKPFHEVYSIEEIVAFGDEIETAETIGLTTQTKEVLIAKNSNNVVEGYVAFRKKNVDVTWISSLYIDPQFQRQGIGEKLLSEVEKSAKESECKLVALETHKSADWAISFYKKRGYEIVNEKIDEYPYSMILDKPPVANRPLLAKVVN